MGQLLLIANIFGYIGIIFLFIHITIGTRHIFKYFSKDTVYLNRTHKFFGKWGVLFVFAHPVLEMMNRLESWSWLFTPNFSSETEEHISLGRIALILIIIIWVTSAIIREKIKWRPWKYIHLLAYPVLLLTFLHIPELGTYFFEYPAIQWIWFFCFFLFVYSFILRVLALMGYNKEEYIISDRKMVGENIILLTLKHKEGKSLNINIGQHCFIQTDRFLSEHPFTVMEQNKETGEITFGIRQVGKTFDRLLAKNVGDKIFLDGPYGVFTKEAWNDEDKIVISAGAGVTPFVDLVRKYGKSITYINCNRNIEEAICRSVLMTSKKYIDVVENYNGDKNENIKVGKINIDIIKEVVGENYQNEKYFICGSPGFIFFIQGLIVSAGVPKKNIYFEELGF